MGRQIETYEEFWPAYLREHSRATCRAFHYLGTSLALTVIVAAAWLGEPRLVVGALIAGYGPAWIGHFAIERNRPMTFIHPFWSLISDFRMYVLWLSGQLQPHLTRAGITQ